MIPQSAPHPWSSKPLLDKAQSYAEEMLSFTHDDWQFAFWSTLSLELLGRAALSSINPALLADGGGRRDWNNLLYALDIEPKAPKFVPRSIDVSTVFERLSELITDFTTDLAGFCNGHMSKRNEELHSGGTPFVGVSNTSWLPTYYRACRVLLESMGDTLDRFLGSEEANVAEAMIAADMDKSAKSIINTVESHKVVWDNKSDDERAQLHLQSSTWATRQTGHRVMCPACNCVGIVSGSPISPPALSITEDEIIEVQEYLPSRFECVACNLKIPGLPQLSATGLGDPYNATFTYNAYDYYAPTDDYEGWEPDFNER